MFNLIVFGMNCLLTVSNISYIFSQQNYHLNQRKYSLSIICSASLIELTTTKITNNMFVYKYYKWKQWNTIHHMTEQNTCNNRFEGRVWTNRKYLPHMNRRTNIIEFRPRNIYNATYQNAFIFVEKHNNSSIRAQRWLERSVLCATALCFMYGILYNRGFSCNTIVGRFG